MVDENILKDIEKESKKIEKWGNKKVSEKDYIIAIIIVTAIVLFFFVYVNFLPNLFNFEKKISVEIIEISGECEDCFDIKAMVDGLIKSEELKIKSRKTLNYNSEEARTLIEEYNIERVPALIIISRDIEKIQLIEKETFSIGENYAIFDKAVPYIDLNSGKIKGLVNLKEIQDSKCEDCMPLSQLRRQLEAVGIKIKEYEVVDSSYSNGKKLINENNLKFLPTLLVSKEIEEYWWVFPQIENSFIEKKEYYVFKNPISPYKEISTGNIKGIVDIIYLTNENCEDCFNVTQLKSSFQSLGIFIKNEEYVDVNSVKGKTLLSEYNITAIPTVILSKEISDYESIKELLEKVGTFENDGKFVFRKLENLNVKYQEIK